MNILFAATFDVSHEYSAAFYVTRMFRYFISSSLFLLFMFCPANLNSVQSTYSFFLVFSFRQCLLRAQVHESNVAPNHRL